LKEEAEAKKGFRLTSDRLEKAGLKIEAKLVNEFRIRDVMSIRC
jgi:hypothetical protein